MTPLSDHEIHERFRALREEERRHVPAFRAMLERAARRSGASRWSSPAVLSLATAAAILLAAGAVRRFSARRDFTPQPLATWTSPTASLLRTPGAELLEAPSLGSSVLDRVTSTPIQR
jgi:hypothetical protein